MLAISNTNETTMTHSHNFGSFLWLKKQASQWSLKSASVIKNSIESASTTSLPLSLTTSASTTTASISNNRLSAYITDEKDLPPHYDDICHPWTFKFPESLSHRIVLPREEEGKETLPNYECTLEKVSYLRVKCEYTKPDIKSKNRSWREYYVYVYGTMITAYNQNPTKKRKKQVEPIWSYSMQNGQVSVATDYVKHRYAFRLKLDNGPQFLFTTLTDREKFDWVNTMETSIMISNDLDVRLMPQIPIPRRRRRRATESVSNTTR